MNILFKYFGMVSEETNKHEEVLTIDDCKNTSEVKSLIEVVYPGLVNIDYEIAINQSIEKGSIALKAMDEVALLPPFAGG